MQAADAVEPEGACPLRFDRHTVGLPKTCLFLGHFNDSCGEPAVAIFAGNGKTLTIGFAFDQGGTTYFAGDVRSEVEASLVIWQRSLQMLAASEVSGSATLEERGQLLRIRLAGAPFQVGDCRFGEYVGHFVDMVDAGPDAPATDEPGIPSRPSAPIQASL